MLKTSIYIIAMLVCLDGIIMGNGNPIILAVSSGVFSICFSFLFERLIENWNYIGLYFKSYVPYFRTPVRLSVSYLFRIKLDDKFLLIQSNRFPHQYIPIGGVYKRLPESDAFFLSIESKTDDKMAKDSEANEDDLRFFILGRYIPSFMKWFRSGIARELSPWREFYQEAVGTGLLSHVNFSYIYYRHIRTHLNGIRYTKHFACYELLIANVYELTPTPSQLLELRELLSNPDSRYIWVKSELIRTGGVSAGERPFVISDHSTWIL